MLPFLQLLPLLGKIKLMKIECIQKFFILGSVFSVDSGDFLSFPASSTRSSELCCNDDYLLDCTEVQFDPKDLSKQDLKILGTDFSFSNDIEPHGYVYKNVLGDEAIIDYHPDTGALFGSINMHDGRSFAIEKCSQIHIWKEFDVASFEQNKPAERPTTYSNSSKAMNPRRIEDRSIISNYSVMIYYTPEFAAVTADIEGWVDLVLEEANEGYKNSEIPIRVHKFCIEEATLSDKDSLIQNFKVMKGTAADTRNTADAAVLFSKDCPSSECWCGVGYCCGPPNGDWSFSVVRKSCALGHYTFGHELGHNLGCHHNRESPANNQAYSYGHGHLIQAGNNQEGSTTIMAYQTEGHSLRANYYSNPYAIYPPTGTPLGVAGVSNNVKVITDNSVGFAAIGDESGQCKTSTTTSSPTTSTSSTSRPTTSSASSSSECVGIGVFFCEPAVYEWIGVTSNNFECSDICKANSDCQGWTRFKSGEWKGWCGLTKDVSCEAFNSDLDSGILDCIENENEGEGTCPGSPGTWYCGFEKYTWVGKTSTNEQCASYCQSSQGCQGWSRFNSGQYEDWCGIVEDSSCVESYNEMDSGCPLTCPAGTESWYCSFDKYSWVGITSDNDACAAECNSTHGCNGWSRFNSGEWEGWCGLVEDISCVDEYAQIDSGCL